MENETLDDSEQVRIEDDIQGKSERKRTRIIWTEERRQNQSKLLKRNWKEKQRMKL